MIDLTGMDRSVNELGGDMLGGFCVVCVAICVVVVVVRGKLFNASSLLLTINLIGRVSSVESLAVY